MANTIVTKNSSTASSVPTAGDLVQGELAVNVTDKRLFTEDSGGNVVELGTNPSTINIDAGTIDGTTIGGTTPAAGSFTTGQFGTSLNVDGTATMDGLTVEGTATAAPFGVKIANYGTSTGTASSVRLYGSGNFEYGQISSYLVNNNSGSEAAHLDFKTSVSGSLYNRARIANNGDISFYEDTGTTPKFFWDASAESLGVGTSSITNKLTVKQSADTTTGGIGITSTDGFGGVISRLSGASGALVIRNNSTDSVYIAGGNLCLGVTPSAWNTARRAVQTGSGSSFAGSTSTYSYMELGANEYLNASGGYTYIGADYASKYQQYQGAHSWYTAPSGTAGNAISFTQAMTLTAGGNLGIGTSSPGAKLDVFGDAGSEASIRLRSQSIVVNTYQDARLQFELQASSTATRDLDWVAKQEASGTGGAMCYEYEGTERARIDSSGNLLVSTTDAQPASSTNDASGISLRAVGTVEASRSSGASGVFNRGTTDGNVIEFYKNSTTVGSISVTASATAYNTSSDYRLKDNIQDITDSGAFIDALQPRTWNWKADGSAGAGFIAHELQAVSPSSVVGEKDAVDADGNPEYQAVEYGSAEVIAMLVAEVKSLRARLTAAGL